jgi:hypothetical protein
MKVLPTERCPRRFDASAMLHGGSMALAVETKPEPSGWFWLRFHSQSIAQQWLPAPGLDAILPR